MKLIRWMTLIALGLSGCSTAPLMQHRPVFGNIKISQLPAAGDLGDSDKIPVVQGGVTDYATAAQMVPYLQGKAYQGMLIFNNPSAASDNKNTAFTAQYSADTFMGINLNDDGTNPALSDARNSNSPDYGCNMWITEQNSTGSTVTPPALPTDVAYVELGGYNCSSGGMNETPFLDLAFNETFIDGSLNIGNDTNAGGVTVGMSNSSQQGRGTINVSGGYYLNGQSIVFDPTLGYSYSGNNEYSGTNNYDGSSIFSGAVLFENTNPVTLEGDVGDSTTGVGAAGQVLTSNGGSNAGVKWSPDFDLANGFETQTNLANGTNWKKFGATAQYNDAATSPNPGTWVFDALNDDGTNPAITDSRNSGDNPNSLYGCNQLFLFDTYGEQAVSPQLPTDFDYLQIGGGNCSYDNASIDMFPASSAFPGGVSGVDIAADVISLTNFAGHPAVVKFNNQVFLTDTTNGNYGFFGNFLAGGQHNSAFGELQLYNCTTCMNNAAYGGNETLFALVDGSRNTGMNGAMGNLVHGNDNTGLGFGALGVAVGDGSTGVGSSILGFYTGPGHVTAMGYNLGQECHTGDYILLWGVDDTTSCGTGSGYGESNVIHVGVGFGDIWSATGTDVPATSVTKIAGIINAVGGVQANGVSIVPLIGTTSSIGGGALAAGACTSGTAGVAGATTSMSVAVSPVASPLVDASHGLSVWAYVSAPDAVTVEECAIVATTPTARVFNVRVLQ